MFGSVKLSAIFEALQRYDPEINIKKCHSFYINEKTIIINMRKGVWQGIQSLPKLFLESLQDISK